MSDTSPFACTLDEAGARARLSQAQELATRLRRRERIDNRLVLEFLDDGHTTGLVDEFVREEKQCCAFFEFEVRHSEGSVLLELSAPQDAGHMLDAAMTSFDPELSDTDRLALQREYASPNPGTAGCGC